MIELSLLFLIFNSFQVVHLFLNHSSSSCHSFLHSNSLSSLQPVVLSNRESRCVLTALSLGCEDETVSPILPISTTNEPLPNRSGAERKDFLLNFLKQQRLQWLCCYDWSWVILLYILYREAVTKQPAGHCLTVMKRASPTV